MNRSLSVLCFCVILCGQSQPPNPTPFIGTQHAKSESETKDSKAPNDNRYSSAPPASGSIDKEIAPNAAGEKQSNTDPAKTDSSPKWLKWSTIVSAMATVFIAVLGFLQWRAIHRQRIAMETQSTYMGTALAETKKSADAARDAVTTASDTAIRQLRAYIGVHQVGYMGLRDNTPLGVGFAFINHGLTPAFKFNVQGSLDLLSYPLPEDFILPEPSSRPPQDGMIYPKEEPPMTGWVWEREGERLSVDTKQQLLSRTTPKEIYAHGTATYSDIFGITRTTKFCFVLNPHSVIRNNVGEILHDKNGNIQFQWAPVINKNDAS